MVLHNVMQKTKINSLVLIAIALVSGSTQPAFSQQRYDNGNVQVVNQRGPGSMSTPSGTYITGGSLSQSAQGGAAGLGGSDFRGILPNVPMGTTMGTASDAVGRVGGSMGTQSVQQSQARNGLAPTIMSTAVGMPSDRVAQQINRNSSNQLGLPNTRMGVAIGQPGDHNRSDIKGTPMYNQQLLKRIGPQTRPIVQKQNFVPTATYSDYNQTPSQRNF